MLYITGKLIKNLEEYQLENKITQEKPMKG